MTAFLLVAGAAVAALAVHRIHVRLQLSRAKHPSLAGHARISRRLAKLVPYYGYDEEEVYRCDGVDEQTVARRRAGLAALSRELREKTPLSSAFAESIQSSISDAQFTSAYRAPFQFRDFVRRNLGTGSVAEETDGVRIRDLDGNWAYDVSGSYGVNLFGYDFYKACIDRGVARARALGPVLGPYHPVIRDNVRSLRGISGLDEISFHMSGTEAVMQAVRLARYHTGRSQLVMFCGAYHGWWDGVQPGVGNTRSADDVYMLKEMSESTLKVLSTRSDIACVLVNPLQALHPNAGASTDAMLINSERRAGFDRSAYTDWLRKLREACDKRHIALIFDEVFLGFRLGVGGAQAYFGIQADMVTYGKTLGGGLPVGVLCGKASLMKRYREDRPTDVCFARGTFNSHPYVMTCMREFLDYVERPEVATALERASDLWDARAAELNQAFEERGLPVRVRNLSSVWVVTYDRVSRFNWMLQYYLRAAGLALSWVGTGRFIFSHNYSDDDFAEVRRRFIAAAERMDADGWWAEVPAASNRAVRRQVLRELISAWRRPVRALPDPNATHESSDQSTPLSTGTAAISDRS